MMRWFSILMALSIASCGDTPLPPLLDSATYDLSPDGSPYPQDSMPPPPPPDAALVTDAPPADAGSIPDGASIPQWGGADSFFAQQGQTDLTIDMLGLYLSSDGGAPVLSVALASGGLPTGFTLDTYGSGAGLGYITGSADDDPGDYFFTLTATNAAGTSAASAEFKLNIWVP